jgi:Domain of unknown function (DUF4258)
MNYTAHAVQRMQQRGITAANINWAMQVGYTIQANGNRRYVRPFGGGNRMFVITNAAGTTVISTWIRGPADVGI